MSSCSDSAAQTTVISGLKTSKWIPNSSTRTPPHHTSVSTEEQSLSLNHHTTTVPRTEVFRQVILSWKHCHCNIVGRPFLFVLEHKGGAAMEIRGGRVWPQLHIDTISLSPDKEGSMPPPPAAAARWMEIRSSNGLSLCEPDQKPTFQTATLLQSSGGTGQKDKQRPLSNPVRLVLMRRDGG